MRFKVFGVTVRLDFSFLLVIYLSMLMQFDSVLYILLFSSLHEMGHIVILLLEGEKPDEISISYYGIGLQHKAALIMIQEVLFLSGGVMMNLVFYFFGICPEINLALALINALPLYPLDGGRIVSLITDALLPAKVSRMVLTAITVSFLLLLLICAICFTNVSLFLIVLYIIFYSMNHLR